LWENILHAASCRNCPKIVGKYAASHNFILLGKHKKTSSGKGQLTHSHNFDDMDELIASIKRLKFGGM